MNRKGFTLIELLVVIAIIALLSALAVVQLNNARGKARDAKRLADMHQIITALEMYVNTYGTYPDPTVYGESGSCDGGWDTAGYDNNSNGKPFIEPLIDTGMMGKLPNDPKHNNASVCWTDGYDYAYYRYPAGNAGCDANRGAFYVLGIQGMENGRSSSNPDPSSPGWRCPGRNWQDEFTWVTGAFEK